VEKLKELLVDINKLRAIAFDFNDLIISIFNKEGIAIFCIFCILIFALASMAALWAFESGQFKDVEGAKFEMLED
jgi:nitrogen fixation-related uncharacterized protein